MRGKLRKAMAIDLPERTHYTGKTELAVTHYMEDAAVVPEQKNLQYAASTARALKKHDGCKAQAKAKAKATKPAAHGRTNNKVGLGPNYVARLVMDEYITPSLALQTMTKQHVQLFVDYSLAVWPCLFKCTEQSLSFSWVAYIDSRDSSNASNSFDLSLRSVTCSFVGALSHDERLQNTGHQLYGRSLRLLAAGLSNLNAVRNHEVLGAAALLSIYEMHYGATADTWLRHHAGIVELMRLRGAKSHGNGFGRAIYFSYRGFFITAALLNGEACIFEQYEWQEMNETIAAENAKKPDSSLFGDIIERAFREMVKVPGLLKRVKDLWQAPPIDQYSLRPELKQDLAAIRASLRGLHTELGITVATHGGPDYKDGVMPNDMRSMFVGPLPHIFDDKASFLAIRGIRAGIVLVNELLLLLTPDLRNREILREEIQTLSGGDILDSKSNTSLKVCEAKSSSWPSSRPSAFMMDTSKREFPIKIETLMGPACREGPPNSWADPIATSYGMLGVKIRVVEEPLEAQDEETNTDGH